MNTIFTTDAGTVRRVMLTTLLALSFVLLTLTGTAHAAQAPAACNSHITSISAFNTARQQTVYIRGQCLGTYHYAPYRAKDVPYLNIYFYGYNGSPAWNACYYSSQGLDTVTCTIQSWTDTQIVFKGFAGAFGQYGYVIYENEYVHVQELNPQYPYQWSSCLTVVGRGSCI